MNDKKPWEYILIDAGLIDEKQAWQAIDWMTDVRKRSKVLPFHYFPQTVVSLGLAKKVDVLGAFSKAWDLPFAEDLTTRLDPAFKGYPPFRNYVRFKEAREKCWLPLRLEGEAFYFACPKPPEPLDLEDLKLRLGVAIEPILALAGEIDAILDSLDLDQRMIGPDSVAREWEKGEPS